ncbi:50S ribosomal protein L30 [Pseudogracilibacillus sp. ICA-222130]|uniref:50S ribosomal protein L30 n=1 Tax=Pseudogracilibacillus sp. ICA-222130 TaxID=3134655 RepID=UPI0030BDEE20
MSKQLEITLNRSVIGRKENQVKTVQALGLKKVNDTVTKDDSAAIRGMINTVSHLVSVKEL